MMKYLLLGVEDAHFEELMRLAYRAVDRIMRGPGNGVAQSGSAREIIDYIERPYDGDSV
jgi:hypothetical protein